MATIKSYTSLEQSRKLAEILPLENADMYYAMTYTDAECNRHYNTPARIKQEYAATYETDIPCWSLAALLGVLPYPSLHKTFSGWRCDTYNENCTQCQLGNTADTPVDACYEMILKLNELKML